jgi:hypothetical protein
MESAVDSIESSAMTHTEKKAAKRRKHWCDAFNAFATIMFFIVVGTLVIHFNEVRAFRPTVPQLTTAG